MCCLDKRYILASIMVMIIFLMPVNSTFNFGQRITMGTIANQHFLSQSTAMKTQHPYLDRTVNILELPYEVKVLFDESHGQYFDSEKLEAFINDLKNEFGVTVDIHSAGEINSTLLSDYDILIIPNPGSAYTEDEVEAIKSFVEDGGALLIMGNYYAHFDPSYIENITKDYGIGWYDAEVLDETNYDYKHYNPIIHTWTSTNVAKFVSNNSDYEVEAASSTALYWTGVNDSSKPVYIVGTGDSDTYVEFSNGTQKVLGEDTIVFMAVDIANGGRIFASGSSAMFRSDYVYYYLDHKWDTSAFAMKVFHWLMGRGLCISNYEAPDKLLLNQMTLINVTIVNNWGIDATGVTVGVELEGAIELLNASNTFPVDTLAAGETVSLSWLVMATGNSLANVTIKVWSDNVPGFSKVVHIQTLGLTVTLESEPEEFLIYERNNFTLHINVSNPTDQTAENVSLIIILPPGLTTENDTTYLIETLDPGAFEALDIIVEVSAIGFHYIFVAFTSDNLGSGFAETLVKVYNALIVFDEGHGQYYDSGKMSTFIEHLKLYGLVMINTGNFTEDLLAKAHLVVIPYPNDGLYDDEIQLLKDYVEGGGKLWIMGNWYKYFDPENLNPLTSDYGIIWNDGEIMDDEVNYEDTSYKPLLSTFADNIPAKLLSAGVSTVLAQGCTYLNLTDPAVPILLGNPTSYGVNGTGDLSGINGTDLIAAAIVELNGGGKIFAIGGTLPFAYTTNPEYNYRFIDNIIRWLIGPRALNDYEAPELEITAPEDGSYVASQTVTVTWSASDESGVNITMVYVDGELKAVLGAETSYTVSGLSEGSHQVKVVVYDRVYLSSEATANFTVDITNPTVTIVSPEEGAHVTAGNITVEFNVTDNIGIDKIEVYLDGELVATLPGTAREVSVNLTPGSHAISIVAYDYAGNQGSALVNVVAEAPAPPWYLYGGIAVVVIIVVVGVLVYLVKIRKKTE